MRGGAVGDFILTLPVLAALRKKFPAASLEVLAPPNVAPLAVAGRLADDWRSLDARQMASFFVEHGALDADWAQWFGQQTLIVSFLRDPQGVLERNVARCGAARFVRGPWQLETPAHLHATTVLLAVLEPLGITGTDPVPRLSLPRADGQGDWLAIHPGSGSTTKNWPLPQWQTLLQRLMETTRWQVLLIGGEADVDNVRALSRALPAQRHRVAECLPLPELARAMQPCAAFIGHDSGITHLAAALGLPLVVLWGPSCFETWQPRAEQMTVLRGLDRTTPDEVLAALGRWHRFDLA